MSDTIHETPTLDEAPPRRLVRVDEGRWLGGVAAGLGRYFDVNPLVYRIAFAALALAGGTGLLLYLAAWLVIPGERSEESVAVEALRKHRDRPWLLLGVGLLGFFGILALSEARFWPGTGNVWLAALLIGGAVVWWHVANRDEAPRAAAAPEADALDVSAPAPAAAPPRPPSRPSLVAPVLGLLLAGAGLFGLLAVLDVYDIDVEVALAGALAVVGVSIAAGALTGRRVGGLVVLGILLLPAFAIAASTPVSVSSGIGDRVERPAAEAALDDSYELGIGSFTVDLAAVELQEGTTAVDVKLGIGELIVIVPDDVALEIDAHAGVGEVDVLGARDDGAGADEHASIAGSTPDAPVLELDADVGAGSVEVRRG